MQVYFILLRMLSYAAINVVICHLNDSKSWYNPFYFKITFIFYMSFLNYTYIRRYYSLAGP